jgi:hypothetical protein
MAVVVTKGAGSGEGARRAHTPVARCRQPVAAAEPRCVVQRGACVDTCEWSVCVWGGGGAVAQCTGQVCQWLHAAGMCLVGGLQCQRELHRDGCRPSLGRPTTAGQRGARGCPLHACAACQLWLGGCMLLGVHQAAPVSQLRPQPLVAGAPPLRGLPTVQHPHARTRRWDAARGVSVSSSPCRHAWRSRCRIARRTGLHIAWCQLTPRQLSLLASTGAVRCCQKCGQVVVELCERGGQATAGSISAIPRPADAVTCPHNPLCSTACARQTTTRARPLTRQVRTPRRPALLLNWLLTLSPAPSGPACALLPLHSRTPPVSWAPRPLRHLLLPSAGTGAGNAPSGPFKRSWPAHAAVGPPGAEARPAGQGDGAR